MALKKSGAVNDLDETGISETLRKLAFQGSDRKCEEFVSRLDSNQPLQHMINKFFQGFEKGRQMLRNPNVGELGNSDSTGFMKMIRRDLNQMSSLSGAPHKLLGSKDFNPDRNSTSSFINDLLDKTVTAAQLPMGRNENERVADTKNLTEELKKSSQTNTDILKSILLQLVENKNRVTSDPLIKSIMDEKDAALAKHRKTQEHLQRVQAIAGIEKIQMSKSKAQFEARRKDLLAQLKQEGSNKKAINLELSRIRDIAAKERLNNLALTARLAFNEATVENPNASVGDQFKFVLESLAKNGVATNKEMISLLKRMFYSGKTDGQKKSILPLFAGLFAQAKNNRAKQGSDEPVKKRTGGIMGFAQGVDRIPAMLAKGEAVIPRDAVEHFGSPFMRDIINQRTPRFATGTAGVGGSKGKGGRGGGKFETSFKGIRDFSLPSFYPNQTSNIDEPGRDMSRDFTSVFARVHASNRDMKDSFDKAMDAFEVSSMSDDARMRSFSIMSRAIAKMNKLYPNNIKVMKEMNDGLGNFRFYYAANAPKIGTNPVGDASNTPSVNPTKISLGRVQPRMRPLLAGDFQNSNGVATDPRNETYGARFMTAEVAKQFSKFAIDMLPKVRRDSTRFRGVARARKGISQFDSSPAAFSSKFRTGFGAFDGANAQQIVNNSRSNRSQRNAGIINPVMRKELPTDEMAKQTAFMRDILVELKKSGETQKSLLGATTAPKPPAANNMGARQGGDNKQGNALGGA